MTPTIAVSDEAVLAACRISNPGLFRDGLDARKGDGPVTQRMIEETVARVRKELEAAAPILLAPAIAEAERRMRERAAKAAESTYAKDAFRFELGTAVASRIRALPLTSETENGE